MSQVSQLVDHEVKTIIAFDRSISIIPIKPELLRSFCLQQFKNGILLNGLCELHKIACPKNYSCKCSIDQCSNVHYFLKYLRE